MTQEAKKKSRRVDWTHYGDFINEFRGESDRAAVILGAAKLDLVLYQILRHHLVPSPAATDELLDGDSPLSSFSAKINMCYRLGLIDAGFVRQLHLVRRIRNAFAHEVSGCSLKSGAHADRVRELIAPLRPLAFFSEMRKVFFEEKEGHEIDFRICLSILVGRLEALYDTLEPLTPSKALSVINVGWDKPLDQAAPTAQKTDGALQQ